jgi:outer membrane protein assembly factor BamB
MIAARYLPLFALALLLVACSNNKSPTCSLAGGTELASTAWPKFQADAANTGRSPVDLSVNDGTGALLFPPQGRMIGATQTTPILSDDIIYLGSSDTNVYALLYNGQPADLSEDITLVAAITGTPLLGADGTLFVPTNGVLAQYNSDGSLKNNAALPGFAVASPNIWSGDGTAYVGTLSGGFVGVCPNGIQRYTLSFPATQSPAAIAQDPTQPDESTPIIVAAGLAGQVRAYSIRGRQRWSFFGSSTINAAVLIDDTLPGQVCDSNLAPTPTRPSGPTPTPTPTNALNRFYVADQSGRVYSGDLANGGLCRNFNFTADAPISASLALGRDTAPEPRLYVADEGGTLYALDRNTGAVRWTFHADGPILSTPAVATGGANDIIVFGADVLGTVGGGPVPVAIDGRVYAVRDDGPTGTLLWTFDAGTSIGAASPSINSDGSVYIGRAGQQLASGSDCPGGEGDPSVTCTINVGGGLYVIGPAASGG